MPCISGYATSRFSALEYAANTTRGGDNADEVSDRAGRWSIALNNLLNLIQN